MNNLGRSEKKNPVAADKTAIILNFNHEFIYYFKFFEVRLALVYQNKD
jgi:hypothetical protein